MKKNNPLLEKDSKGKAIDKDSNEVLIPSK